MIALLLRWFNRDPRCYCQRKEYLHRDCAVGCREAATKPIGEEQRP